MGNNVSLADNQDVEYQSGASRLCNSIIVALCLAPLLLLGGMFLLGFNEKRSVCDANAIIEGKKTVAEVPCSSSASSYDGKLVMFACDIQKSGLPSFSLPGTDFSSSLNVQGTGLTTKGEMLQCVEQEHSETHKGSGGSSTTTHTYTYSVEWKDHHIDSGAFKKKSSTSFMTSCGVENPPWPSGLPQATTQYAEEAKVGPFTVPQSYVQWVPLNTPVSAQTVPTGWTSDGTGTYGTNKFVVAGNYHSIGQAKVSFKSNDWSSPTVTVLGESSSGGLIGPWTASSSWLCSGSTLSDLRPGTYSKDGLFKALSDAASALTWLLRLLGFCVIWFACSRFAGPLGVVADCIPCIGPWLGDKVECVACCITCFPSLACSLGIIGVVWVAMRPLVGIPLLLIFLCTCGAGLAFKARSQQQRRDFQPQVQMGFGQQVRSPFV